jgi:hypothetical protein
MPFLSLTFQGWQIQSFLCLSEYAARSVWQDAAIVGFFDFFEFIVHSDGANGHIVDGVMRQRADLQRLEGSSDGFRD